MSSVFVMIAKFDLPSFEKGDIITALENSSDFGASIKNNEKFRIVEVLDTTIIEAESLVLPLTIYNENPDMEQELKARQLTVDVDVLSDYEKTTKEYFMSLITRKEMPLTNNGSGEVIA